MIDAYQLGARVAQRALSFSGACGCPSSRPRMAEALGLRPGQWWDWRRFQLHPLQGISTCLAFASNMLDLGGIDSLWRGTEWQQGRYFSHLIDWAIENNCWQPYVEGCVPNTGDMPIVGADGGKHICVCTDCDGVTLQSIDGGQECGHPALLQSIQRRERAWGNGFVRGTSVSPVVGWIDVARAPLVSLS